MKKILLLLVLVGNITFAQKLTKEQLSEKLAEKACGCAEKQEITKQKNMKDATEEYISGNICPYFWQGNKYGKMPNKTWANASGFEQKRTGGDNENMRPVRVHE